MGRKIYLPLIIISLLGFQSLAQTGELRGRVTEKGTTESVPFAHVAAYLNGSLVQGAQSDFDGNYVIKPLSPGKYDIKVTYTGYTPADVTGIIVF